MHDPLIIGGAQPLDEPPGCCSINELHGAVVAQ